MRLLDADADIIKALKNGDFINLNMKNKDTQDLLDLASELRWEVGENFHDTLSKVFMLMLLRLPKRQKLR